MAAKTLQKLLYTLALIVGLFLPSAAVYGTPLAPFMGGTGIESTTNTDAGKVLMVSTTGSGPTWKWSLIALPSFTTPTLQQVTDAGATTNRAMTFAGGTSTAGLITTNVTSTNFFASSIQGTLGTFDALLWTSATGTNANITNLTVAAASVTSATIGSMVATNATSTNLFSTNGNFTFLTAGTINASNATITNVSTTNMTVATALDVSAATITGLSTSDLSDSSNICLLNANNTFIGINTFATTTVASSTIGTANIGNLTVTNTLSLPSNSVTDAMVVNALTISGGTIDNTPIGASTSSTGVFTNATSTNFFATNLSGTNFTYTSATGTNASITNLTGTNATITNVTSTNLFSTTGTFTNLVVTAAITGASLAVSGNATIGGTLGVTGASTFATTSITALSISGNTTGTSAYFTSLSLLGTSYPTSAGTAGKIVRSNGSNLVMSTSLWPDTTTINQILYSSAANTISGITTANSGVLVTNGTGVPSIATDIPTAVTIGSSYIYRAGGTDVTVPDGGTGNSSFTANGVLLGNGTSALQVTATGTANQVLTSNGGGTPPTFQALPSATWGTSTLSSGFTLSSSAGTFQDTGLSITLPSAGTYYIYAIARGQIAFSTGVEAFIQVKFYNSTDSVYLDDGSIGAYTNKTGSDQLKIHSIPIQTIITVNGSKTIKLYAARMSATGFLVSSIESNSEGRTRMGYYKLTN